MADEPYDIAGEATRLFMRAPLITVVVSAPELGVGQCGACGALAGPGRPLVRIMSKISRLPGREPSMLGEHACPDCLAHELEA